MKYAITGGSEDGGIEGLQELWFGSHEQQYFVCDDTAQERKGYKFISMASHEILNVLKIADVQSTSLKTPSNRGMIQSTIEDRKANITD